jgi:hypothetical protein
MTRAEQIRKALDLLVPAPDRRDECRRDIEHALARVDGEAPVAFRVFADSKPGKAQLERYVKALRKVCAAHRNLDLAIQPWYSPPLIGCAPIEREIADIEAVLERKSPSSEAKRHWAAIWAANDLLRWWKRKIVVTRSGEWSRLS